MVWVPSRDAVVRLTRRMCENKDGEENILQMVGRSEYVLQLSVLSALVKINSLKLLPMGPPYAAVITTSEVGGCLMALYK